MVNVFVVSLDTRSERRFDLHTTVQQLKAKLESVTGIPASAQRISLHNSEEDSTVVATLDDSSRPLGFYGVHDWQVLRVEDTSPPGASLTGQFTDVSQVEKFELSEAEYAARRDTVLAYKQRNRLGRFSEPEKSETHEETSSSEANVGIKIGQRCEVEPVSEGGIARRGIVQFIGSTEFGTKKGTWVGVQYDEPVGKNDGSVDGHRYFSCPAPYGGFVRPEKVRVGDFPPVNLEDELDEI
ncbi:uncharacterized protein FOMMEDRAFT_22438 [Fomitiporia mediterranea MF3/22]|uniref:uncharacterized protein n=1 Tax=Fomitiporia mediterranea (strain MF3/22) TaxID=694068 RepID=UPI0004408058|nr:uncharacterized protein FOMMEDRAFT_22438 [Fomitiporia mediterranea MF3/22]EJC99960.1 hypothetical protein FOMMEDRAFT_22438 [Fomitiporia mediterranea MF3/22]